MTRKLRTWLGLEWNPLPIRERILSSVGGALAIAVLYAITKQALGLPDAWCVLGSMGASAVLLFAAPHGQLSQPWPVVMGHVSSALVGVFCAKIFGNGGLSAGLAVGLAILVMQALRCLHPPGGATALTAVVGGEAIQQLGFAYVIWPVLLEASVLVGMAMLFNASFVWRRYPAAWAKSQKTEPVPAPLPVVVQRKALEVALHELDSFIDLSEADLNAISQKLAQENLRRATQVSSAVENR